VREARHRITSVPTFRKIRIPPASCHRIFALLEIQLLKPYTSFGVFVEGV
jgi:hypothetical protein